MSRNGFLAGFAIAFGALAAVPVSAFANSTPGSGGHIAAAIGESAAHGSALFGATGTASSISVSGALNANANGSFEEAYGTGFGPTSDVTGPMFPSEDETTDGEFEPSDSSGSSSRSGSPFSFLNPSFAMGLLAMDLYTQSSSGGGAGILSQTGGSSSGDPGSSGSGSGGSQTGTGGSQFGGGSGFGNGQGSTPATPEPGTWALFSGLSVVGISQYKKQKRSKG
jgi:hypothetical protein